jgi:hypothetical protein
MKFSFSTIIIWVIVFVIGFGAGYISNLEFGKKMTVEGPVEESVSEEYGLEEGLKRKIEKIFIFGESNGLCANLAGEVVSLSKDGITISNEEAIFDFRINESTRFYSYVLAEELGGAPLQKEIGLNDVKEGDAVSIYSNLTKSGELIAGGVSIQATNLVR